MLVVPTQRISSPLFETLEQLAASASAKGTLTPDEIAALFADEPERQAHVERLWAAGYLEQAPPGTSSADADANADPDPDTRLRAQVDDFADAGLGYSLPPRSLFHVPTDLDDSDAHVVVVGVPVASRPVSSGTVLGPGYLRQLTMRMGTWFDAHRRGFYSEIACNGSLPEPLARGVVLEDGGDVGADARTVRALFEELRTVVDRTVIEAERPTVFIGGDHAITFPIVHALLHHHPDLCLIHFDAHHDALYDDRIAFDHALPIRGLLAHSNLQSVYSFGLRAGLDPNARGYDDLAGSGLAPRLHPYSLAETKRLIATPERLQALLRSIPAERPVYLSIDLDVLSTEAMRGRVSTPAGTGLEWHELYDAVRIIMEERRVIAADIVELCPSNGTTREEPLELPALLVLMIDRLARASAPR